jgi:hypothetical protein
VGEAPKYGEIKGDFDEAVTYSDYEPSGGGLHDLLAGALVCVCDDTCACVCVCVCVKTCVRLCV